MNTRPLTRRRALACCASLFGASPVLRAQQLAGEPPGRIAPVGELVNVFEVEAMAQRKLDSFAFAAIAGSDRRAFDRITFRPRLMVDTVELDLGIELFGRKHFAPILVGPVAQQGRFHPEGELAMRQGAAAASTVMVAAGRSTQPIERIAGGSDAPLWYQLDPDPDLDTAQDRIRRAVGCGCQAVCLTLGAPAGSGIRTLDWRAIDRLRESSTVPFLLKGIMTAEEASAAASRGVQGIVVSSYRGGSAVGLAASIEVLPAIAAAVTGRIPILVDGSFRRGTDILKALALGAQAVLLGRPPVWGLAAYGAAGVQRVLELVQGELARSMALCGRANVARIDRSIVKLHRW